MQPNKKIQPRPQPSLLPPLTHTHKVEAKGLVHTSCLFVPRLWKNHNIIYIIPTSNIQQTNYFRLCVQHKLKVCSSSCQASEHKDTQPGTCITQRSMANYNRWTIITENLQIMCSWCTRPFYHLGTRLSRSTQYNQCSICSI